MIYFCDIGDLIPSTLFTLVQAVTPVMTVTQWPCCHSTNITTPLHFTSSRYSIIPSTLSTLVQAVKPVMRVTQRPCCHSTNITTPLHFTGSRCSIIPSTLSTLVQAVTPVMTATQGDVFPRYKYYNTTSFYRQPVQYNSINSIHTSTGSYTSNDSDAVAMLSQYKYNFTLQAAGAV